MYKETVGYIRVSNQEAFDRADTFVRELTTMIKNENSNEITFEPNEEISLRLKNCGIIDEHDSIEMLTVTRIVIYVD